MIVYLSRGETSIIISNIFNQLHIKNVFSLDIFNTIWQLFCSKKSICNDQYVLFSMSESRYFREYRFRTSVS